MNVDREVENRQRTGSFGRGGGRLAGAVAAFLGLVASMMLAVPGAQAIVPGIDIQLLHNGNVVGDDAEIPEGADLVLAIFYQTTQGIDGQEITITLPPQITAPGLPPGNEAIEAIEDNGDGTITVRFHDPIPPTAGTQGELFLDLGVGGVDEDTEATISWEVGQESGGVTFTIEHDEVPPHQVSEGWSKGPTGNNQNTLDGFMQFELDPVTGDYEFTGLSDDILNSELTFNLQLNTPPGDGRTDYPIADQLPAGFEYVTDSFPITGELRTFNPTQNEDHPFDPGVTAGDTSFAGQVTVPGNSELRLSYRVQVAGQDGKEELEAQIRDYFENDRDNGYGQGWAQILRHNTATFGGDIERQAPIRIGGNVPGVGVGVGFGKTGDRVYYEVITDEDGLIVDEDGDPAPIEMIYTLQADLTPWTGNGNNFTLFRNVVISDTLPAGASWATGAGFITVSDAGGVLTSLSEATGFTGDAAAFADNQYVGQYAVVGQTLLINVGDDNETDATIDVRAQLNSVADLGAGPGTSVLGGTSYAWPNTAQFYYRDGAPYTDDHDANVVELPDERDGGINDYAVFNKEGPSGDVRVSPGETAQVSYRFTIDTSRDNIDPLNSRIVDEINTEVFDLSDLDAIEVSGSYAGQALGSDHFTLSVDDDDHLVIELSTAGQAVVAGLPADGVWIIDLVLTTVPFDGKETFEVYNRATLYGTGDDPDYWSEDNSVATSFGDEAETRKRVFDFVEELDWVEGLNALIHEGDFLDELFAYRIEFIPRGNYGMTGNTLVADVVDVLPDAVEFIGFVTVDENGVPNFDQTEAGPGPVNLMYGDVDSNLVASFQDGVVTISQAPGTRLNPQARHMATYYLVRALDASEPIVNTVDNSSTTITGVGDPSIDIEKWNDEGSAPEYDPETGELLNDGYDGDFDAAPGKPLAVGDPLPINFTISNDGREDLVDIGVSDELTPGTAGAITDLSCDFSPLGGPATGTEWEGPFLIADQFECNGTLPALESGDEHANTATVTGVGILTEEVVDDEDDWHAWVPVPSVDIEKWTEEEGSDGPEYDPETGELLNDGYEGDFDEAPGKPLAADEPLTINFTISNDGEEPLVDIEVSDELAVDTVGLISDLECVFPDGSTGVTWDGPFAVGAQFDCTGTLPPLENGLQHSDNATVTGAGLYSGTAVDDEDEWHGWVPVPSVDIEKWNDEGEEPEYDASGALLNDGYAGDHDQMPGAGLAAHTELPINFTISNDGEEPLVDIEVTDELIAGVGEITDLVCTFPDDSTGVTWDGPFAVGAQFDCTGTLPALEAGEFHSDNASVTAAGLYSGTPVDDDDDWHGYVPVPSIDIEKWTDEGSAPAYDEAGNLLNDGYDGDFDEAPGKKLTAGGSQRINLTISNNGGEPLIDILVGDVLVDGVGEIQDLSCEFPDGSTGLAWSGLFAVGTQFDCTGTLPGLDHGDIHSDTASVTAVGAISGLGVGDADDWHGHVDEAAAGMPSTGANVAPWLIALVAVLLLAGVALLLVARRRQVTTS